jgi:thiol-disulfide isomerase/thioredoxin
MENKFLSSIAFWKILVLILFIAAVGLGVMVYQKQIAPTACNTNEQNNQTTGIGAQAAAEKAIKYINQYLITDGSKATVKQTYEEKTTYYKFDLDLNGTTYPSYVSTDGKYIFPSEPYDISKFVDRETKDVEGSFKEVVGAQVCKENDKPIVYFFGSSTCPHCTWEKPVIQAIVANFGDKISYHENIDSQTDSDIFSQYSTGSIPTVVIGCKYYRVGSGESAGEDSEKQTLTNLICDITGNQPESVCK